jgi:hypothetical protein
LLDVGDARGLGYSKDKIVLSRHPDVFEFERIEFNAGLAEELLKKLSANEMADGETVGFGHLEEMVRRNQSARSRHVVNDDGRSTGNMIAEVAGNKACVGIVPATWRGPNDDPNCFPS